MKKYALSFLNSSFTVIPEVGANINLLVLNGIEVIEGNKTEKNIKNNAWHRSAILIPFPNRINDGKYNFLNEKYSLPINFPAQKHAIHGLLFDKKFEVKKKTKNSITLHNKFLGTKGFPWKFDTVITYSLNKNGFVCKIKVTNKDNKKMPAGLGWHPYFMLGEKANNWSLKLPAVKKIVVNKRQIPTGKLVRFETFKKIRKILSQEFDTGFKIMKKGVVTTEISNNKLLLQVWQDRSFPYLQVFIPPSRKSIAIEPMSCNTDAFNNKLGLKLLGKNKSFGGSFGVKLLNQ